METYLIIETYKLLHSQNIPKRLSSKVLSENTVLLLFVFELNI